jgi:DivIVA domain-containing protein
MEFGIWILVVVVLGMAAFAAAGRFGEMPPTVTDMPRPELPAGPLTAVDLRAVRFAVVPRGYSMQQVDELLDRLASQLGSAQPARYETGAKATSSQWPSIANQTADDPFRTE